MKIARVELLVEKLDYSFLDSEIYKVLEIPKRAMIIDVKNFIYEELFFARYDAFEKELDDFQAIVEDGYESFISRTISVQGGLGQNKYDAIGENRQRWLNAYYDFEALMVQDGYDVYVPDKKEKSKGAFNVFLRKNGVNTKIKLKSRDKINRIDPRTDDEWFWIEAMDVYGNEGWLYGEAETIVFEMEENFFFISRKDLETLIAQFSNLYMIVDKKFDILKYYVITGKLPSYQRKRRKDKLILTPSKILLSHGILRKKKITTIF